MSQPYLSIVIPAYNESINFRAKVLNPVVKYLVKQKYSWEVLFVDDGSTDKTHILLEEFCQKHNGFRLIKIEHGGKASAVTAGVLAASGQVILFTDFDQSTPIYEVSKFITRHQQGGDVVTGIRTKTQNDTWVRKIRSWAFVKLVNIIALPEIRDSQCGFKSFTSEAAQKIFSSLQISLPKDKITGGYMGAFDVEVLFLAKKFGFRIDQIPVDWIKILSNKLNIWREPLMMLRDILKVRLYAILGKYEK
ncbi:MAG: glycosyltransferase [Patescibacteria group bacterium]